MWGSLTSHIYVRMRAVWPKQGVYRVRFIMNLRLK